MCHNTLLSEYPIITELATMNPPHLPGNEVADGCEPGGLLGPQRQHVAQGAVQRGEPENRYQVL